MKIIVQNIATEYTDEGTGPAILLLPGWMNTLRNFDALTSELTQNYRVVRLDLPGFRGGTELPPSTWFVADYASFVAAFVECVGLSSYVLVGHSFGGRVALKGVGQGTLRPSRLVLLASAGIAKSRTFRNRALTVLAKAGKLLLFVPPFSFWRAALRKKLYESLKSDYLAAGPLAEVYKNAIREDLREYAKKIEMPTLLVWGSEDDMTPLQDGEILARLIKHSRLEVLLGVGHSPHRDRPQEVARLIESFLA